MITFRLAKEEDLEEVFQVAAEAFLGYDFFGNYEKDYKKRWRFVYEMEKICLLVNFRRNQLIVGEENNEIVTVIALHEPGSRQAGTLEYILLGIKSVFKGCNFFKVLAFSMMDDACEEPIKKLKEKTPDFYYLHNFAVRKDYQRKGCGTEALTEYLSGYIKEKGGGTLALITNSEDNVIFYKKCGFTCYHKGRVKSFGFWLGNWAFKKVIPGPEAKI